MVENVQIKNRQLTVGRVERLEPMVGSFGVVTIEEELSEVTIVVLVIGFGLVITEELVLGRTIEVEETFEVVGTEDEEVGACKELLLGSTVKDELEETFGVVAEDELVELGLSVVNGTEVLLELLGVGSWIVLKLEIGAVDEVVEAGRATPADEDAAQFVGASLFNCS